MQEMTSFFGWLLDNIPDFLMSEPIIYFITFILLGCTVDLIRRIINL